MSWLKGLVKSRKFWLTVIACGAAYAVGCPWMIPPLIMGNVGAIAYEDGCKKRNDKVTSDK